MIAAGVSSGRSGGDLGAERPRLDRRRARRALRRRGDRADQHPLEGRRGGVRPRRRRTSTLLFTTVGFLDTDTVAMLDADPTDAARTCARSSSSPARDRSRASGARHRCTTLGALGRVRRGRASVTEEAAWERLRSVQPTDTSDTLFTSGTTGRPKGVVMTHAQTVAQFTEWCDFAGLQPDDRYLIVNPFFHMFGYKAGWLASLLRGRDDLPGRRVRRADGARHSCRRERITMLPGAPDDLPVDPRPSRSRRLRPEQPAGRGHRCGRHPRRADRADARRAAVHARSSPATGSPKPARSRARGPTTTRRRSPPPPGGRCRASRSSSPTPTRLGRRGGRAGHDRRAARARLQRDAALPRRSRGDRRGDRRARLPAHRRPRHDGRARLRADHRPPEGHDHRRRLQRVPGRGRERAARPIRRSARSR